MRDVKAQIGTRPHGTRARYVQGCRCAECRAANAAYNRAREKALRYGLVEPNPLVPADEVRAHLKKLSAAGVGRKTVAKLSGVQATQIVRLRKGITKHIRQLTARRILAVTADQAADNARVDAARTRRQIAELRAEGFSRAAIVRALGMKSDNLPIRARRVSAATARAIDALWRQYMLPEGAPDLATHLRPLRERRGRQIGVSAAAAYPPLPARAAARARPHSASCRRSARSDSRSSA